MKPLILAVATLLALGTGGSAMAQSFAHAAPPTRAQTLQAQQTPRTPATTAAKQTAPLGGSQVPCQNCKTPSTTF